MELQNKVIVVTGAFGSLGVAVVRAIVAQGAKVAALDRAAKPHDAAVLSGARLYGGLDIGSSDIARGTFAQIAKDLGGVDGLVNIAGAFRWETLEAGKLDTWDLLYNVNLRTAAGASQAALPHILARGVGGRIVNIGAAAAAKAAAGMGAYTASKAGVAKLTEALAEELKERGITVNAVLPSIIDTPANREDMPNADFSKWVAPAQLAEVIVFLLSARSQAVTGALIPVVGRV
jgi:NAD(P)-dependent dehydrogenase (short-subunit alcohol dehydrogenase family)